jgi:hypothetical protein
MVSILQQESSDTAPCHSWPGANPNTRCGIPDFTIAAKAKMLHSDNTILAMRIQTQAVSRGCTTASFHATTPPASLLVMQRVCARVGMYVSVSCIPVAFSSLSHLHAHLHKRDHMNFSDFHFAQHKMTSLRVPQDNASQNTHTTLASCCDRSHYVLRSAFSMIT